MGGGLLSSSIACQMAKAGIGTLLDAAGLESTIIWTPLVGKAVAAMVKGSDVDPSPAEFAPCKVVEET